MAVTASFRVDVRPYSGFTDPSLPVASWIAQGGVAGDASGGVLDMRFIFQRDGDAQISELFNIEQFSADTSAANSRSLSLETLNMDQLSANRLGTAQVWRFTTSVVSGPQTSALFSGSDVLPLWLGSPNRDEGDAGLRFQWQNIDLLLYFISIQGYMWGPRSVLAEGGPRRPVGGLFGP